MQVNDLIAEIYLEREWRIQELAFYKKLPFMYVNFMFNKYEDTYFKMCIPMLYAHWEGFVINTFRLLAEYISKQSIKYELAPEFLILLANKKRFEYLKGNCNLKQQTRFLREFLFYQKRGIEISPESCISANSNLNYKQFIKILNSFNICDAEIFINNKQSIEKLVTFRNKIAHGENSIIIKQMDVHFLINSIIEVIDKIIVIIEHYASNRKYLVANQPSSDY